MELEKKCWEIINDINTLCNKKTVKNLSSTIKFKSEGNKTKWKEIQEIELNFNKDDTNISITMTYTKDYNDSGKNLIKKETYQIKDLYNIDEETVKPFLVAKKRILVISTLDI